MAGQSGDAQSAAAGQSGTKATVAGGLMQALEEHPGWLAGLLDHFHQNGMSDQVQSWATGSSQGNSTSKSQELSE